MGFFLRADKDGWVSEVNRATKEPLGRYTTRHGNRLRVGEDGYVNEVSGGTLLGRHITRHGTRLRVDREGYVNETNSATGELLGLFTEE
jgi:hypothetical protein